LESPISEASSSVATSIGLQGTDRPTVHDRRGSSQPQSSTYKLTPESGWASQPRSGAPEGGPR
jgi:hypothetical protein